MKYFYFIFIIPLIFIIIFPACSSTKAERINSNKDNQEEIQVIGGVVKVQKQCDPIPDSNRQDNPLPVAMPGHKVVIKQGDSNKNQQVFKTVFTDENGSFRISLPKGQYCFITELRYNKDSIISEIEKSNYSLDKQCFNDWWNKCDDTVVLGEANPAFVDLKIYSRCEGEKPFPCVE